MILTVTKIRITIGSSLLQIEEDDDAENLNVYTELCYVTFKTREVVVGIYQWIVVAHICYFLFCLYLSHSAGYN